MIFNVHLETNINSACHSQWHGSGGILHFIIRSTLIGDADSVGNSREKNVEDEIWGQIHGGKNILLGTRDGKYLVLEIDASQGRNIAFESLKDIK